MSTIKKLNFTLDQLSDVQFDTEKKIVTFVFGGEIQKVLINPKDKPIIIQFSDNKQFPLTEIADVFELPEINTAAIAFSDTSAFPNTKRLLKVL